MTKTNRIRLAEESAISRRDLTAIIEMIPEHARILDLGCGSGRLLKALSQLRSARIMGVEKHQDEVIQCTESGVPVIQADLDDGLPDFPDHSWDFVILSRTLQAVRHPDVLLDEMLRVGKTGIVSFLNIGYWRARYQLCFGTMPETKTLPYKWYDTPNIHLGTIADFRNLCKSKNIRIVKEIPLPRDNDQSHLFCRTWPNMFAATCIFLIEK